MRLIFTLALLILFSSVGFSQQGYFAISSGYGFQTYKNQVESFYSNQSDNQTININQPAFSLGQGLYFGLNGGYFFNDNLGFELGLQFHKGHKEVFNQQTMIISVLSNLDRYLYGNRWLINPSVIVRTNPEFISFYLKIGPSIGIINQTWYDVKTVDTNISEKYWKYSGPTSIGINSSLGITIQSSEKTQVFMEFTNHNMIYKPEKADVDYYIINGKKTESGLMNFEKHIVYRDWLEDDFDQTPPDPNEALIMFKPTFAYHNINMSVGVRFLF